MARWRSRTRHLGERHGPSAARSLTVQSEAPVLGDGFTVMLNDDFPEMTDGKSMTPPALGGTPVTIHLTVTDVDSWFQRAVDAGAAVVAPLEEQFWGDRYGVVRDPFGHLWSLGQPVREVSMDEVVEAMREHQ
nr:VOC family protein [Mycolicibacterium mengxianglii]